LGGDAQLRASSDVVRFLFCNYSRKAIILHMEMLAEAAREAQDTSGDVTRCTI
jgi:hypothetical protein